MFARPAHQRRRVAVVLESKGVPELVRDDVARHVRVRHGLSSIGLDADEVTCSPCKRPGEGKELLVGEEHYDVARKLQQRARRLGSLVLRGGSSSEQPDLARIVLERPADGRSDEHVDLEEPRPQLQLGERLIPERDCLAGRIESPVSCVRSDENDLTVRPFLPLRPRREDEDGAGKKRHHATE